ncbi:Hypothetical protein A7982_03021 [Minicystis rosea]|nr:Hypothetical protein A7982_03021 [Minicystis rosea]
MHPQQVSAVLGRIDAGAAIGPARCGRGGCGCIADRKHRLLRHSGALVACGRVRRVVLEHDHAGPIADPPGTVARRLRSDRRAGGNGADAAGAGVAGARDAHAVHAWAVVRRHALTGAGAAASLAARRDQSGEDHRGRSPPRDHLHAWLLSSTAWVGDWLQVRSRRSRRVAGPPRRLRRRRRRNPIDGVAPLASGMGSAGVVRDRDG